MGLATRCPACGTGFRVSAEQLKAHHGTVRCGRCDMVFNAFDSLVTLSGPLEAAPRPEQAARPQPPVEEPLARPEPAPEPVELLSFGVGGAHRAAAEEFTLVSPPPEAALPPAGEPQREEAPQPAAAHPGQGELALGYAEAARARRSGAWGAGALALALAFVLQLAYVLRAEIAGALPQLRPALEEACAALGCTLPLPRRVEQWNIESSDLQADPAQPYRLALDMARIQRTQLPVVLAVLHDRAGFAQEYPALELTLTDTQDQPLARRVFGAADYLPPGTDPRAGLGANGEVVVRLTMDTGDLNAAGYRLFLFYP